MAIPNWMDPTSKKSLKNKNLQIVLSLFVKCRRY